MKIISRDLAIVPLGLGPFVTAVLGHSSPWTSLIMMEFAVLLCFFLDGYFRLREGEEIGQVCRGIALRVVVGIPLMAISLFLGWLGFGYLDEVVASFR